MSAQRNQTKKRQSYQKKSRILLRDDYIPDLLLLLCRWFGIFFRFRSASSSRSPWRSFFFLLCGQEKNNFPRLLTCKTVENEVPIDESGVQQQQQPREREKPKNVAHDPLWLTIQFSFRRQDRSSSSALSTAKSTGGTILEIQLLYPIVVARLVGRIRSERKFGWWRKSQSWLRSLCHLVGSFFSYFVLDPSFLSIWSQWLPTRQRSVQ